MVKKMLIIYMLFIIVLSGILLLPNKNPVFLPIFNEIKDASYCYIIDDYYETNDSKIDVIKNGNDYIINTSKNKSREVKPKLNNIKGETISFKSTKENALNLLKKMNVNILYFENIDNILIFYGYTNNINNFVYINSDKVNIQLAVNKENITIGTPLILNSY